MFADMLDAPIPKLTVCHNVNVGKNFLNTGSLLLQNN